MSGNDKHTPGPWAIFRRFYIVPADHVGRKQGCSNNDREDLEDYAQIIGSVDSDRHRRGSLEANARLIAAAPDLLAACEAVVGTGFLETKYPAGQDWVSKAAIEKILSALAKAKEAGVST